MVVRERLKMKLWWYKLVRVVRGGGKSLLWRLEVVEKVCYGGDGGDDGHGFGEERGTRKIDFCDFCVFVKND